MKVYLSGRMSGLPPETWRWRFASWEVLLGEMGYEVVNPADTIIARHLWLYKIVGYRLTLAYDLWLLKRCSHIFMVGSDWRLSKGARLERMKAREWGIKELNQEMENRRKQL